MERKVSAMESALTGPERSGGAHVEEVTTNTERSLENERVVVKSSSTDLEHSDMAREKAIRADTERSMKHEGEGTNNSLTEGGSDDAPYLRGLAAEVVNQDDLERSIARQV